MRLILRTTLPVLLCGIFSLAQAEDVADLQRALGQVEAGDTHRADWAWHTNYAQAGLALKKAKLLEGGGFWGATDELRDRIVKEGLAAIQRLQSKQQPPVKAGALNEFAYITDNDLTAQPYYLYLPPNYKPTGKWPLIVFLHGYVPTTSVLEPWVPMPEHSEVAGKHGCLLLVPYGRRNTDFQGVGEVDVLAAIEQVKQVFRVDEDRIYLSGVSMGGMGAWNMALRHPGRFAAVTPMCGQTDMFLWWGWPREEAPWWKRWLVEWDNAADQAPNLREQNVFVQHGEQDTLIPVEQSRLMVAAAEKQGTPIKLLEYPGQSHFIYFNVESYEAAWSWQKQFTLQRAPARVDFKTYSLEYDRAFWLTIGAFDKWGLPATATAQYDAEEKTVQVATENVAQLSVDCQTLGLPADARVVWNGKPLPAPTDPEPGLRKRHGLCGPCEEVFDTRFLLVQGTAGDDAADTALAQQVAQWAKEWDEFADGLPPVKTDAEVTEADLRQCNLVLFGTPDTNSVLGRMTDKLPIKIGDHRYEVNGKVYAGEDLGLVMCYPNPLNPERTALIYSGERYGEQLSINHKHDLLPDFVVFTTESFGRDQTNDAVCAGFFGMRWELRPELTWEPKGP
jgi:poly(3-hydroxybutyrate) depolymerase